MANNPALINYIKNYINTIEKTYKNLERLSLINKELYKKCFYLVFGGFAIDGILGRFTRPHKDIDLLCFRKDIKILKNTFKNIALDMTEIRHHKDTSLIYKLVSSHKICTCHILDQAPDNCFEISFYHFIHQSFPFHLLTPQLITLHNFTYPIPTQEFLYLLKEQENNFLNQLQKNHPQKLLKHTKRHNAIRSDLKLLKTIL